MQHTKEILHILERENRIRHSRMRSFWKGDEILKEVAYDNDKQKGLRQEFSEDGDREASDDDGDDEECRCLILKRIRH